MRASGRVATRGTDNPELAEMADLTMTIMAELLQSPDPADRVLALQLYGPVYDDIRKAKEIEAEDQTFSDYF